MHKALYPKVDIDILYASRTEGGRELIIIEHSDDTSIQRLLDCLKKAKKDKIQRPKTTKTQQGLTEQR